MSEKDKKEQPGTTDGQCRTCQYRPRWNRVERMGGKVTHEGYCKQRKRWVASDGGADCWERQ